MKPRIAIFGAGAVGGYAGAHMVQAGEDVTFIDPWPEHVEAMRKTGLRITHLRDVPEFTVKPRALPLTEVQALDNEKPIDIAFMCMKSYETAWATTGAPARPNRLGHAMTSSAAPVPTTTTAARNRRIMVRRAYRAWP
jgi:ketopantoate reductase